LEQFTKAVSLVARIVLEGELCSLAKRFDVTMRLMAGNLRQALDGFESDRRTLQRFEGAKAQR
jgi:hypothetical protein